QLHPLTRDRFVNTTGCRALEDTSRTYEGHRPEFRKGAWPRFDARKLAIPISHYATPRFDGPPRREILLRRGSRRPAPGLAIMIASHHVDGAQPGWHRPVMTAKRERSQATVVSRQTSDAARRG